MRIAIYNVTTSFQLGGIETYCLEIGKALASRGHDVTLIAGSTKTQITETSLKFELFDFTDRHNFWNLGTRFRKLMERLSFSKNAVRHLLENNYDAILITKPYDFTVAWLLKKIGYKGTIVFHTGGTDFFQGDRIFVRAIDHCIACSRHTAKKNEGRYSRPFHVIYNGVDTALFRPLARRADWRSSLGIPENARVVMTVGRIVGWKGLDIIINAIANLDDVHYVYVGQGPYETHLLESAKSLSIANRVHPAGSHSHQEIPDLMNQADLFAQPSIGEEAFGITLIEAMACGLPVLASAQGGMLEILEDKYNGLLLPPGDIYAWREAIERLIKNNVLRETLGAQAKSSVQKQFSWNTAASLIEGLLCKGASDGARWKRQ